ncbi:MAG TPA: ABC transporter permease subunit, partial [Acidimicrobiia bacterium]|nr:ABC transporter permease subunit [Acidimicrobiia bacterium]
LMLALSFYTASHVAEIVRGSILAVPRGQTEAANALSLSGWQRLRFVVLPQAMRIAVPPIINQYLNYVKNTSLGIAVGFAEVTLITFQAIGNARPAPQLVLLLMAAYLAFSLTISALVNVLNRRLQYVTT